MQPLTRITDHVAAGLALRMAQYQSSENLGKLLTAFLTHNQRIEDALFGLAAGRLLTGSASGATLDGIGRLVGIDRNGLADAAYRVLLYAKIAENYGDATLLKLETVALALFDSKALFAKSPVSLPPSGKSRGAYLALMVGSPAIPSDLYPLVQKLLTQSLTGGVELAHLGTFNTAKAFACAGPQPWVGGWGSIKDNSVGAPLASLIYASPL